MTGFIALSTYIATAWPEVRKVFYWRDQIKVTSFDSRKGIALSNFGDGDIYVSHIRLNSTKPKFSSSWSIDALAKAKSFSFHKIENSLEGQWSTGPIDENAWQKFLLLGRDDCFGWNFLDNNNPHYENLQEFCGNNFRSLPLVAHLIFYSSSDGRRLTQEFSIYAVPFFNRSKECSVKLSAILSNTNPLPPISSSNSTK